MLRSLRSFATSVDFRAWTRRPSPPRPDPTPDDTETRHPQHRVVIVRFDEKEKTANDEQREREKERETQRNDQGKPEAQRTRPGMVGGRERCSCFGCEKCRCSRKRIRFRSSFSLFAPVLLRTSSLSLHSLLPLAVELLLPSARAPPFCPPKHLAGPIRSFAEWWVLLPTQSVQFENTERNRKSRTLGTESTPIALQTCRDSPERLLRYDVPILTDGMLAMQFSEQREKSHS